MSDYSSAPTRKAVTTPLAAADACAQGGPGADPRRLAGAVARLRRMLTPHSVTRRSAKAHAVTQPADARSASAPPSARQGADHEAEQFAAALDAVPLCVYAHDLSLRYTWVHAPRAGFTAAAMIGKRDEELLPLDCVVELIALKREALATAARCRRLLSTVIDGRPCTYDVTAEPRRGANGALIGLLVVVYDVTEAMTAYRAAQAANLAKDHFLAVLSHELRTPLMPVLATARMLAADESLGESHRAAARLICRNVELEARLLDDLLDLTRLAHGKLELRLAEVDLNDAVRETLAMLSAEAVAKGIMVSLDLAAESIVRGDAVRLQQVISNLLRNAIKFTPHGGEITLLSHDVPSAGGEPDRVALVVSDTGIGIDAALLPRIFDPFEQGGPETTRHFGGIGLGLSITRSIVAMHGGRILAQSDGKDAGTTFTVQLPASPAAHSGRNRNGDEFGGVVGPPTDVPVPAADTAARSLADHAIADDGALAGCVVLLVEDHADAREVLTIFLTGLGCTVRTAENCAQAISRAQTERFDLVVSDLGLPDGSGHALMRRLRDDHGLRGIALSGYGMAEDLAESRDAGFAEHLLKPVDIGTLSAAITRLLRRPAE